MKKGLFVFDLDGTALGGGYEPYMRLPDPMSRFLDGLVEKGWQWAVNTAWNSGGQWKLVCESAAVSRPQCLIAEFGRRMAVPDGRGGLRMLDDYEARHAALLERVCGEKVRPLLAEAMKTLPVEEMVYYGHLANVRLYDEDEEGILRFLERWMPDGELEIMPSKKSFSVRPAPIHKGLGIEGAEELFGWARGDIVAAGDSLPDLAMMKAAGWSVCPSNADERVRAFVSQSGCGCVGEKECCDGVIAAFNMLAERNGWFEN